MEPGDFSLLTQFQDMVVARLKDSSVKQKMDEQSESVSPSRESSEESKNSKSPPPSKEGNSENRKENSPQLMRIKLKRNKKHPPQLRGCKTRPLQSMVNGRWSNPIILS